jgi:hypothetical protein
VSRGDLAIVLTATIVPNAPFVQHTDPQARRDEYLTALRYYSRFARVFFLENSTYPLLQDPDFARLQNVMLRSFPRSENPERGKGYQEFEMIDRWVASAKEPPRRFLKISGRYLFRNFEQIWSECQKYREVLIDQYSRSALALSQLFCTDVESYRQHFMGAYAECDDVAGRWIERVLYKKLLASRAPSRCFATEPWLVATSGSTGLPMKDPPAKHALKQALRTLNVAVNNRRLCFR